MHPAPGTLHLPRLFVPALIYLIAGCSAGSGQWPSLALPRAAPAPAPAAPVVEPSPPRRDGAPASAEEAAALTRDLPDTVRRFTDRIREQTRIYEAAREHGAGSGDALDRRSAEFELSRLSQIETELAALLRRLEGLVAGEPTTAEPLARLRKLRSALDSYLDKERRRLAALGGR